MKAKRAPWLALILAALALTMLMLALSTNGGGFDRFWSYLAKPLIFALNFLPVLLLTMLGYFITGRTWAAALVGGLPVLGLALVNHYKLLLRNDPLLAEDLLLVSEAGNISGRYRFTVGLLVILTVLAALIGLLWLILREKRRKRPSKLLRGIGAGICACLLALTVFVAAPSEALYRAAGSSATGAWTPTNSYVYRGMLYPFLHSVAQAIDTPPEGYSEQQETAKLAAYQDEDISQDKKVNVICVMLEAMNDFSAFDGIKIDPSVYAPLHALQGESLFGHLVTNIFAGGTVDTERCFLTGWLGNDTPRAGVDSYVWYFRSQGYATCGVHPWYSWFYNRQNINEYLGFERYDFLEQRFVDQNGKNITTDEAFFSAVYEDLQAAKAEGRPLFSYSLSYQNHGPYPTEKLYEQALCAWREGYNENDYHTFNNYLAGVKDTWLRLSDMVQRLREETAPVVLIVFGDHNPWLGDGNSVYRMLGIDLDQSTEQGLNNYYRTPYLVWQNEAAHQALGTEMRGEGGDMGPYYLLPAVMEKMGLKGSAAMQVLREQAKSSAFINPAGVMWQGALLRLDDGAHAEDIAVMKRLDYVLRHRFSYRSLH